MIKGVDRGTRSRIYERIVQQLQTDPVLTAVFGRSWDVGYPQAGYTPPLETTPTGIRLEISASQQSWRTPSTQGGAITLTIYVWLPKFGDASGPNVLDCMDVWEAIEDVFYSPDIEKRRAFKGELQSLGAATGEAMITNPAVKLPENREGTKWVAIGQVQLNVDRNLNRG
jgi:hypothetical protein